MARNRPSKPLFGFAFLVVVACGISLPAHGQGITQVVTSQSLPQATIDLVDPETGISAGTDGSIVRLAAGDIFLLRSAFMPLAATANRGMQGYITAYLPANTQLVGVRIIDANGNTLEPRYPGLAVDGCTGGAYCNSFTSLPCSTGTCSFQTGSVAQLHADTGVFFSNDSRLTRNPAASFMTMRNGILMSPKPRSIDPVIVSLLGDTSGTYYAHNQWDWEQIRAFGVSTDASGSGGDGNTPYLYGSPVAGPDTFYRYEATEVSPGTLQFNNVIGPWTRMRYPGSTIGTGVGNLGATSNTTRALTDTSSGTDVTPASPATAKAVRIALGETRAGEPGLVELALRVTGLPLDPDLGNAACVEATGGDLSSKGGVTGGRDNPWPWYVGSPACTDLRLLLDLDVDKDIASSGDTLQYSLRVRNLALAPETNAVARLKFDASRMSHITSTVPPDSMTACSGETFLNCLQWNLGTLQASQELAVTSTFSIGGSGSSTVTVNAAYHSDQIASPGYSQRAVTVVQPLAVPRMTLSPAFDPTTTFVAAETTAAMSGTVSNAGTTTWTQESITFVLPTGWSISGTVQLAGAALTCSSGCGTSRPTYAAAYSYNPNQARALTFSISVPAGTSNGLHRIDLQTWGSQSASGSFETYVPRAAFINVGAVRTERPVVTCPIVRGAPTIAGTSEADAAISLRFNALERGTATANGAGAWTSANYTAFGDPYGGLEVTAVATAPGELPSEPSSACFVRNVDCTKAPAASNDGPYCESGTIQLSAAGLAGATYAWTGPNGFASSEQNPTIPNATAAHAGIYSVTTTYGGCTSNAATTDVVVTSVATPVASSGGPYCEGQTIGLNTPPVDGATYQWEGPQWFFSTDRTPTIPAATTSNSGTYSVTVTVDGCMSAAGTTDVIVEAIPAMPDEFTAASAVVALGQSNVVYTVPEVAGMTYQWTYSGTGVTITGSGNSVTLSFSSTATSGTLGVTAGNDCGASAPRTIAITVTSGSFGAPPNLSALATSASEVSLGWTAVTGATAYEIFRSHGGGAFALLTTVGGTAHTDSGLAGDTTYLYRIRAVGSEGASPFSVTDPATTIVFVDEPLNAGAVCKATHVAQLRIAVNAMRVAAGRPVRTFTDDVLSGAVIRALHIDELRAALDEARAALAIVAVTFTDPTLTSGTTLVKRDHIVELRNGVK